jgi:indole-3-glycerol phosphate synthase
MTFQSVKYSLPQELRGTILDRIVTAKILEIEDTMAKLPAESLRMGVDRMPPVRSLKKALLRRPGIIAELKKASPSAGLLRPDFHPETIASAYVKAGAAALSVVTEANFFQGGLEILAALRWQVELPLLRKDFIVDYYQILEARRAGADVVLLIAALLDGAILKDLCRDAAELGMETLVEVRSEEELARALEAGADLIGVNNRDLRTFEISLEVSQRLAGRIPRAQVAVAESGIRGAEDVRRLADAGYRGFLIGESLMRAPSPGAALSGFVKALAPEPR